MFLKTFFRVQNLFRSPTAKYSGKAKKMKEAQLVLDIYILLMYTHLNI